MISIFIRYLESWLIPMSSSDLDKCKVSGFLESTLELLNIHIALQILCGDVDQFMQNVTP